MDLSEFLDFMRLIEKLFKHKSKPEHEAILTQMSPATLEGLTKIALGTPVRPEENLLSFLGVPSNFRRAITSRVESLHSHSMESMLSHPAPAITTFVSLAALSSFSGLPEHQRQLVQLDGQSTVQAIVSLKDASGIPKPNDRRERDVQSRKVNVCMYDNLSGAVVGNVHSIPVYWSALEEDRWKFSKDATGSEDYKFLLRTRAIHEPNWSLLIEFIVVLRAAPADPSSSSRFTKRQMKHHPRLKTTSKMKMEMTCCWCKVPLSKLLAKDTVPLRFEETLQGGTVAAPLNINAEEILNRRSGWRAVTQKFQRQASETPRPILGIKSIGTQKWSLEVGCRFLNLLSPVLGVVKFDAMNSNLIIPTCFMHDRIKPSWPNYLPRSWHLTLPCLYCVFIWT